ncbi:DMT family transporter [Paractinoplanes atraurantiacus]|uniref:Permease of the drug/metabolite transporter (DMT) superfamily n=1 Tax=Paractinoplanes atraurantiacus TaxID=1036182 RepID=A0A285H347_9ACTN|nr:DMT family transporter [Actinoplanes atraurantiacus]SNY30192.1 Permease of the drug/metabolite transporter (DMT) superfamily [Actinoplanes atraurantiacus]
MTTAGWFALGITVFGSLCYATASILQAVGARRSVGTVRTMAHPLYMLGLLFDILAWIGAMIALRELAVYVVESILAGSLAITVLVARFALGCRLRRRDAAAVVVTIASLSFLALSAGPQDDVHTSDELRFALCAAAMVMVLVGWGAAKVQAPGGLIAAFAGLSLGGAALIGRSLPVPEGLSTGQTALAIVTEPLTLALLTFAATGMMLYAHALQHGDVGPVTAIHWTAEVCAPSVVAMAFLGDTVRDGWLLPAVIAGVATVSAAVVLATAPATHVTAKPEETMQPALPQSVRAALPAPEIPAWVRPLGEKVIWWGAPPIWRPPHRAHPAEPAYRTTASPSAAAYPQPAYPRLAYSQLDPPQPDYSQPAHSQPAYPRPAYPQLAYSQLDPAPPGYLPPTHLQLGPAQSGYPQPGHPELGPAQFGYLEAGYSQSGYPQPGSPEFGSPEFDPAQSGYPQPGSPEFGSPEFGPAQSRYPQSNYSEPGYQQLGPAYSGHAEPGYAQPGHPQPGYPQPGYPQHGYPQPGYPQLPARPAPTARAQAMVPPYQAQPGMPPYQAEPALPPVQDQPAAPSIRGEAMVPPYHAESAPAVRGEAMVPPYHAQPAPAVRGEAMVPPYQSRPTMPPYHAGPVSPSRQAPPAAPSRQAPPAAASRQAPPASASHQAGPASASHAARPASPPHPARAVQASDPASAPAGDPRWWSDPATDGEW